MSKKFNVLITVMAVIFVALACLFGVKGCENGARSREKLVETEYDNISVEQENLFNSLTSLAENVQFGVQNETQFQQSIAEMRKGNAAEIDGNIQTFIGAVSENPPAWASIELLKGMNTAIQKYNENVAKVKKTYRKEVENYEYYTEKWPNSSVLSMQGYKVKKFEHFNDGTPLQIKTEKVTSLYN